MLYKIALSEIKSSSLYKRQKGKKVWQNSILTEQEKLDKGLCPTCGDKLERIGGCVQCKNCGFSKCD